MWVGLDLAEDQVEKPIELVTMIGTDRSGTLLGRTYSRNSQFQTVVDGRGGSL